jgi:hypothetical protein
MIKSPGIQRTIILPPMLSRFLIKAYSTMPISNYKNGFLEWYFNRSGIETSNEVLIQTEDRKLIIPDLTEQKILIEKAQPLYCGFA